MFQRYRISVYLCLITFFIGISIIRFSVYFFRRILRLYNRLFFSADNISTLILKFNLRHPVALYGILLLIHVPDILKSAVFSD